MHTWLGQILSKPLAGIVPFFSLIPISILLVVLIKILVNVNTQREVETAEGRESRQPKEGQEKKEIDIKGTISIAITITSFLIALTQLQSGSNSNSNTTDPMSLLQVIIFSVVSLLSLAFFIRTERRSESPLMDLNLIKDKFFFPSTVIVTIVGITMFMIYPTIVQLVRSPQPLGFGGDAVAAGNVQLPFMIAFMILGPTGGIIISKLGSIKPLLIGSITIVAGFSLILVFHFTESTVMLNLAILGLGYQ